MSTVVAPEVSCGVIARVADEIELANLLAALESVRSLVDEFVIVLDDRSAVFVDAALEAFGARVLRRRWTDDFAAARNAAQEICRAEWVLYIDSDEVLVEEGTLRAALAAACERDLDAVLVTVRAFGENGLGTDTRQLRLYRRSRCHWVSPIHEELMGVRHAMTSSARLDANYVGTTDAKVARNLPLLLAMAERECDNPKWAYYLTDTYFAANETERVAYWAERCIAMAPDDVRFVDAWINLVLARLVRADTGERSALATVLRGLTHHPKHPDLWHALAVIGLANWFHLALTAQDLPTIRSARFAQNLPPVALRLGLPLAFGSDLDAVETPATSAERE